MDGGMSSLEMSIKMVIFYTINKWTRSQWYLAKKKYIYIYIYITMMEQVEYVETEKQSKIY